MTYDNLWDVTPATHSVTRFLCHPCLQEISYKWHVVTPWCNMLTTIPTKDLLIFLPFLLSFDWVVGEVLNDVIGALLIFSTSNKGMFWILFSAPWSAVDLNPGRFSVWGYWLTKGFGFHPDNDVLPPIVANRLYPFFLVSVGHELIRDQMKG